VGDEPDDGGGPAVEDVEGVNGRAGELPEQAEGGKVRDVFGLAETDEQSEASGDGGHGGAGPGQLPAQRPGRVMLPGLQWQLGDGGPDQVLVAVPDAEPSEAAVQGGGVIR
jgi:hypothetical protein